VVLAVTLGSFTYGYCASILGNIFGKAAFFEYMDLELVPPGLAHTDSLIAAWSALLYVGGFIGCCIYPLLSSRFGRRFPLGVGSIFVIVGGALQAGTVDTAMLCVARIVTGVGIGHFLPGCPLYQAEVAPAHHRGLMVGLHACVVGAGFAVAQWIGVAFFHVSDQAGWRVPLAIQCAPPAILLSIIAFLPESPRWCESTYPTWTLLFVFADVGKVYLNGRVEEAEKTLTRLHQDKADPNNTYTYHEFMLMKAQLDLEAEASQSVWNGFKDPHMRKRFIVGWLGTTASQSSGAIVILSKSIELEGSIVENLVLQALKSSSLLLGNLCKVGIQSLPSGNIDCGLDCPPHDLQSCRWHPYRQDWTCEAT
jgi:MFS family permease